MDNRRYYTKKDPFAELEDAAPVSVPRDDDENIVFHHVNERYTKKDRELTPQTFVVVFSGGTKREKDYLCPITENRKFFPRLKLEFYAKEEFDKGGRPIIFPYALERQKVYRSSTEEDEPDLYFLVTDVDDFGDWVTKEIPNCNAHGIRVLVSNPCFEVWLYYATKKDKLKGFVPPKNPSKLSESVKTWCGTAVKGGLRPKQYLFCLENNIVNAKANYCYDAKLLYGGLYSTNVFELGEAILPMVQEGLEQIQREKEEREKKFRQNKI